MPLLLILIWAALLITTHAALSGNPRSEALQALEDILRNAAKVCRRWIPNIVRDPECLGLVRLFFPAFLHFPRFFEFVAQPHEPEDAPSRSVTRRSFPEAASEIWIDADAALRPVGLPPPTPPEQGSQFVLTLMSTLFAEWELPIPIVIPRLNTEWCSGASLFRFLSRFFVGLGPSAFGEMCCAFFGYALTEMKCPLLAPWLLHAVMQRLRKSSATIAHLTIAVDYAVVIVGAYPLMQCTTEITVDLLTVARELGKGGITAVHGMLLALSGATPTARSGELLTVLEEHMDDFAGVVASQGALHCWIYVLLTSYWNWDRERVRPFVLSLFARMKMSQRDTEIGNSLLDGSLPRDIRMFNVIENAWKGKRSEFQAAFAAMDAEQKKRRWAVPDDFFMLSVQRAELCYAYDSAHYVIGYLIGNSMRIATVSAALEDELRGWRWMTNALADPVGNEDLLKAAVRAADQPPRTIGASPIVFSGASIRTVSEEYVDSDDENCFEVLSGRTAVISRSLNDLPRVGATRRALGTRVVPRCQPFRAPTLFDALPEGIDLDLVQLFKIHARFLYARSLAFRTNLIVLLRGRFVSRPIEVGQCELHRFALNMPAVVFLFEDHFSMLTSCTFSADRSDLQFDPWDLPTEQYFIESALMGHWGPISIFASRIIIRVNFHSIFHVEVSKTGQITVWSAENGLFSLRLIGPAPRLTSSLVRCNGCLPPSISPPHSYW
jgi:hypothetical protein